MKNRNYVILAAVCGMTALGAAANAGAIVDLRFHGETGAAQYALTPTANRDYVVDVWVKVTGADAVQTNDGFQTLFGGVSSGAVGAGAITGAAGVGVIGTAVYNSNLYTITSPTGAAGLVANITTDTIQDWGSATTVTVPQVIKFNSTLGATPGTSPVYADNASLTAADFNLITGGAEFRVGSFTIHVDAVNATAGATDKTTFTWTPFAATGAVKNSTTYQDTVKKILNVDNTAAGQASVAFVGNAAPSDVNELVLATVASPTVANGYTANAGTVNVVSSGAFTSSNVVTTDADKKTKGSVNISWPGEATSGPVWVMMWVTGTGVLPTPAGSTALYTTASHAGAGTMWDSLVADYSAAGGGAFNYLAYYANGQTAPTNGFFYDLVGTGLSLDKIAVVPEPASLGLLALGALGLLSRKRR